MCSETSEAVGTTWEHAQLEFQKFLKIRIPLMLRENGTSKYLGALKINQMYVKNTKEYLFM